MNEQFVSFLQHVEVRQPNSGRVIYTHCLALAWLDVLLPAKCDAAAFSAKRASQFLRLVLACMGSCYHEDS